MKKFMICGLVALLGGMFSACSHNEPVEKTDLIDCDKGAVSLINAIELYDAEGNNLLSKKNPNNWLDRDMFIKFSNGYTAKFEMKEGAADIACPLQGGRWKFGYIITHCYDYIYGPVEEYGVYSNVDRFIRRNTDDYALYPMPAPTDKLNITICFDSPDSPGIVLSTELIDGDKDAEDYNGNSLWGKECVVTDCSVPYEMSYRAGGMVDILGCIICANIKLTLP